MSRDDFHNNHGYSLLEALIASVILATALLSLAQLMASAVMANAAAGRTTYAALLASQKIEQLRASSSTATEASGADSPAPGFLREWSVGVLQSDPDNVSLIEVIVRASGTQTRMVALKTRTAP